MHYISLLCCIFSHAAQTKAQSTHTKNTPDIAYITKQRPVMQLGLQKMLENWYYPCTKDNKIVVIERNVCVVLYFTFAILEVCVLVHCNNGIV